jgi:small GTP-binding protein
VHINFFPTLIDYMSVNRISLCQVAVNSRRPCQRRDHFAFIVNNFHFVLCLLYSFFFLVLNSAISPNISDSIQLRSITSDEPQSGQNRDDWGFRRWQNGPCESQSAGHVSSEPCTDYRSQFVTIESIIEGTTMLFEVWDTAGQEVYRSLVGFYARDARGAFIVTDLTSMAAFQSLSNWVKFIRDEAPAVKIVIFANKVDLEAQICVRFEHIVAFANENRCEVIEGSAKTGLNVSEAFSKMGELMLVSIKEKQLEPGNSVLALKDKRHSEVKCC